ncbi:MAG: iron-sulfur cluster-binding domain-containing protein, partial [Saprospiraceae bacterium]
SPTRRDCCEITVKHEEQGTVSHYMHTEVHECELLQLTAPSGKFTFTGEEADSIVLIGGGVGVTPMMSVIRYLTDRSWKGDIYLFFSCNDETSIIFREEIAYLQKRYPNLHVCIILEELDKNRKDGFVTGRITKKLLTERVPDLISRRIHICGPPAMMDAIKKMLDELKVPKENVFLEVFSGKVPSSKPEPKPPEEPGKAASLESATPDEAGKTADPTAAGAPPPGETAKTAVVTFSKSNKTAILTPDKSILEASEDIGVNIEYSCRVGTCGICKTKMMSGKVVMAVQDALTEEDKGQNIILACQAKATEDVVVEA